MSRPAALPAPAAPEAEQRRIALVKLERQVLGAALLDPCACAEAIEHLRPEVLSNDRNAHRAIFRTLARLFERGETPDALLVAAEGGHDAAYLLGMMADVGTTVGLAPSCRVLTEAWIAREAAAILTRALPTFGQADVFDALDDLQARLSALAVGASGGTHISEAVAEALRRLADWQRGHVSDLAPTGFAGLDAATGGFPVGELTTLAAMTGAGKTSLLLHMASANAHAALTARPEAPQAVLLFSCEMNREQVAHRTASALSGLDLRALRSGHAAPEAYDAYGRALQALSALPLHIDDTPAPTFRHIAARCRQLAARHGLAFVGVDYDEKVDSEGATEELRVSAIARGLKDLAKRFAVPVVALSQYSRNAAPGRLPDNGWLRYSGMKEHESAVILHWHYPKYWVDRLGHPAAVADYDAAHPHRGFLICTKNRFGPEGKVPLDFDPRITRFSPVPPEPTRHAA